MDKSDYSTYTSMYNMLHACQLEASKLEKGEISKEEYDAWRYKELLKQGSKLDMTFETSLKSMRKIKRNG